MDLMCSILVYRDRGSTIDIASVIKVHSIRIRNIVVSLLILLISLLLDLLDTTALITQAREETLIPFVTIEAGHLLLIDIKARYLKLLTTHHWVLLLLYVLSSSNISLKIL